MSAPPSETEQRVLAALDEDALVETLAELVRVPSVTGSAEEGEVQHLLAERYRAAGLEVDLWAEDLDELRADPAFPGTEAPREEAWGLVGTTPGEGEPALVLNGHVDVVPVGDRWSWAHDPFAAEVQDGRLHGRGACDMKAGVAVNLAVAQALARSGVRTERRLALHSVVGEEDGGLGAFATLRRGHTGEAVVITEPTAGRLLTANAGALTFRIEVPGRAAHGSTRLEGQSALESFLVVHEALRALETARNADPDPLFQQTPLPYAITVGTVHAGDWASSVPDLLTAEGRLGVVLGESTRTAAAELERAVAEAAAGDPWLRDHPPRVTWPGGRFASGRLPEGHPLADEVAGAAAAVGMPLPSTGAAPYGSDLRLYAGDGVPTLQFGPGDVRLAHSTRESVDLAQVVAVARALTVLAVRRLEAH
ncbi:ArgE/DapE family deacylase [Phycicoccus endophyticus]|uniref:ArgE/DapE family deacylase n=1 Tax=Phycicoccus endophyticus TaxID=1690220 RepID=A0A7G9R0A4_9MICO|nr:ArgE/DapE family deacylase [Phycicoccus endophyticus]NHI20167.1 ArgE/DapE family deacylase [Phycicoccus endophyticus]QNN49029.1 ArgE/DapE family deacylase [Phycicoccus endophyticus]GGL44737.1 acetylornithine deacetylase [Phycicoccus endophyticus]